MTWYDGVKLKSSERFSTDALYTEIANFDWMDKATQFEVPAFIVAGRYDKNKDADLAHEYFGQIEAPVKNFKWFEQSAHPPPFEEPKAFNKVMIQELLPVVREHQ
tara:strand:+ start:3562 stop:3876 length:315 start_codon:yes stop_codon:yes gene_type:complete